MKRQYKTLAQKRRAWYRDDDIVKALYLVASVVALAGLYFLTWMTT